GSIGTVQAKEQENSLQRESILVEDGQLFHAPSRDRGRCPLHVFIEFYRRPFDKVEIFGSPPGPGGRRVEPQEETAKLPDGVRAGFSGHRLLVALTHRAAAEDADNVIAVSVIERSQVYVRSVGLDGDDLVDLRLAVVSDPAFAQPIFLADMLNIRFERLVQCL